MSAVPAHPVHATEGSTSGPPGAAPAACGPKFLAAVDAGELEQTPELLLARLTGADENERERIRRLAVALFADLGTGSRTATDAGLPLPSAESGFHRTPICMVSPGRAAATIRRVNPPSRAGAGLS